MKAIQSLAKYFKTLRRVSGKKGVLWLLIAIISSIFLSATEYFVAIALQILLAKIGLINSTEQISALSAQLMNQGLLVICLLLIIAGFVRGAATYIAALSSVASRENIVLVLRKLLYKAEISEFESAGNSRFLSAAEINYQVTDLLPNSGNFVLLTVQAFTIFCQILLLIVGLYSLASLETFVVLIAFSIIGLLTTFLTKKVRNAAKKMPISQRRLLGSVQRVSRNRVLIAISKTANWEINRLNSASQDYHDAANKTARYVRVLTVFPPFMGIILITVIIYLSRNYFHTEPQVMLPFLYLLLRFGQQTGAFAQQIGSLNTFVLQFQDAMKLAEGWYERVSSFKTVARIDVQLSDIASKSPPVIQIKKLSFGWHPDQDLFQGLSMEIGPGEQVAIVGTSGRGKSTLLYLLLGLLKPSSGSITIAGILPSQFLCHPDSKIGYVGTDAYLISGSVRENILYGLDPSTISQETIHRVLGDANLLDTVEKLPNKLDHLINENGEGLSAGQKQRLSLARALLRMPKLLILDEASANLDNETEAQIAETLRSLKGTVTTVIVSHRQGLVKYADRVLSL